MRKGILILSSLKRLQCNIEHQTNVADLIAREIFQYRYQIEEFIVVCIREPAADWYCVLRVEDVRRGRVIDDNGILEVTANLGEILPSS